MSSILRALKKLESDPRHLEDTRPLDSTFVPLADTSPKKTSAVVIMLALGGGLVCGLVILGGWWLFSEKTRPAPGVEQNISRQDLQQKGSLPAAVQETALPERKAVAAGPVHPVAEIPDTAKNVEQIPASLSVETVQPPSSVLEQETIPAAAKPAQEAAMQEPAEPIPQVITALPETEAGTAVTRTPEVTTKAQVVEVPVLNDSEMKLQAITWSKDPQKRIVVINNRILRQGETISGYRIATINQDDVMLSSAGKKWKLLFRIN